MDAKKELRFLPPHLRTQQEAFGFIGPCRVLMQTNNRKWSENSQSSFQTPYSKQTYASIALEQTLHPAQPKPSAQSHLALPPHPPSTVSKDAPSGSEVQGSLALQGRAGHSAAGIRQPRQATVLQPSPELARSRPQVASTLAPMAREPAATHHHTVRGSSTPVLLMVGPRAMPLLLKHKIFLFSSFKAALEAAGSFQPQPAMLTLPPSFSPA